MGNKVMVSFSPDVLPYTKRLEILMQGTCKTFFPASIIQDQNCVRLYFETTGYRVLSQANPLTASALMETIRGVLEIMEAGREFLFVPEEYKLANETIYINEKTGNIRFIYVPEDRKLSYRKTVNNFLHGLHKITTEQGSNYLRIVDMTIREENFKVEKQLAFIDELLTEIKICGIM